MSRIEEKLGQMSVSLPPVAAPAGAYVPALEHDGLVYTSGQLPFVEGSLPTTGKVGAEVSLEDAQDLAAVSALNALASIKQVIGDLDRVTRVLKVTVFVASDASFTAQPQVANGASELIGEAFGELGKHVRSAVGVAVLPLNSPVELEVTVAYE
ncbi:RidA family protein [Gulosibacter molinativorax]|uniref:RidA family protein n=1 Tax=Gulosibacter molinativorax TaxID=256821 RepID=A0ABT7CAZ5_9MICO|nr:RidA family protein [Gulosibacter molinativorax]MDJ1372378.1 RidA family protein [Gulosibacter molinativorax]QUY63533.1 Putative reactive intermediate deaminase TdcF [Gulosibacter molinativorax]